ncbi:hypothetical protein I0Q91_05605 [Halanaerobiaceae bacterium Z-7014]|uniref:Uncharacterized protein n=1 Tax=Halonatronomonas betaini TaxID=2778430 RepID=A0A931F8H0_9FIRM|nr:hypothetical protein [Halonatronomonas betaini]MBF8436543.1 hypothetical protein [Halonatronomonas betaini]
MKVNSRHELYTNFNDIMNNVYVNRRDKKEQNYNQNLIKTYLVEGHINKINEPSHDDFLKFFAEKNKKIEHKLEMKPTNDEYLFKLNYNDIEFFLDAANDKRFFLLHTSEKSADTDKVISQMISRVSSLDNIWLTKKLMQFTKKYSYWRSISLNHNDISIESKDSELGEEKDNVNIKVDSGEAKIKSLIEMLNDNKDFSYLTGISHLSLLIKEDDNSRILDDLRYDGKFSTRGDSFNKHLWLVNKIYDNYKKRVYNIEENYTIGLSNTKFSGLPINIEFSRKDLKLDFIIKVIFSNKKPFKLWGYPEKINDDYYKVHAIDLHSGNQGNKMTFEITKDFITLYLSKNNCGNTVARLICNIQQYLDSEIKVWGGDDNELF